MRLRTARMRLVLFILLAGCDPLPVQYPPGSSPYPPTYPGTAPPSQSANLPAPGTQPQPQISGAQRGQYVWDKVMEGVVMGGAIAGPYGAGGGLIIGLITGLLTADSHHAQLNAQIQTEQAKEKELEAQIEQELERQRELEAQLRKAEGISEPRRREEVQIAQRATKETKVNKKEDLKSLASLGKKEISPAPPTSPFKNVEVRDINGDGAIDLWSYYENTRLVRRDVSAAGLQHLSEQEKPAPEAPFSALPKS